jgi:hypothetical protein
MDADSEIIISLTRAEYSRLLLMMGFATGSAFKEDRYLAYRFMDLANRISRDNPDWKPYDIPEEFQAVTKP